MSLEKVKTVDLIEVTENDCVHVRVKTTILDDGNPVSSSFHRYLIAPGDDYSAESTKVKAICAAVHTPLAIAKFEQQKVAA
jgi:hypothetical protein